MLSKEEIISVGKLAKLDLSSQEAEVFGKQLSNILDLFKEIDGIDLENVEETSQITGITNIAQGDIVYQDEDVVPSGPEKNLDNTPFRDANKILTPQVIER